MAWIEPGTFRLGSPASELDRAPGEGPQTTVTLTRGFFMGRFEVTQNEYQALLGTNPSAFTGDLSRPVEGVTWSDATNFCVRLTQQERGAGRIPAGFLYRLPTEAEWEYASRAGTTNRFSHGDDPDYANLGDHAWTTNNSSGETHAGGEKLSNPWQLFDLHGNVSEWCGDWSAPYPGGELTDPTGPVTGTLRVLRGGDFNRSGAECRCASRAESDPGLASSSVGFRIVLAQAPTNSAPGSPDQTVHVHDSLSLSNALATSASNSRIMMGPGIYPVTAVVNPNFSDAFTGPLLIANKTNLVIEGSGDATVITTTNDGDIFALQNVENVSLSRFRIERSRYPSQVAEGSYTLFLGGTNRNITLDSISINGAPNHAIGGATDNGRSDEVVVRNCRLENCGATNSAIGFDGAGIQVCGKNWLIDGCFFTNCIRGVEIYNGGGLDVSDCHIVNCTFDYVIWQSICTTAGGPVYPQAAHTSGITIIGNTIKNVLIPAGFAGGGGWAGNLCGILLNSGWSHRVIGNRIYNIQGWADATPHDNPGQGCGIILSSLAGDAGLRDIIIANNSIRGCKYRGIWVSSLAITNLLVANNIILSNGAEGISLQSQQVRVIGNTIADNAVLFEDAVGISVAGSGAIGNHIADNFFYNSAAGGSQGTGIHLTPEAIGTRLLRNVFLNTPQPVQDTGSDTVLEKVPVASSALLDFQSLDGGQSQDLTIPVAGSEEGDTVDLKPPSATLQAAAGVSFSAWAANGVVIVRCINSGSVSVDPPGGLFKVIVR